MSDSAAPALLIDRALSYPYERLDHSYSLRKSAVENLPRDFRVVDRIPVIACGSNAAPEQLIRKFSSLETTPIYVTRATLADFICCYSAHITSYGSIPATLAPSPGATTHCHITWLTETQLAHMHKTEAVGQNYRFSCLEKGGLICEKRGPVSNPYAYISLHGNLLHGDHPVALSGIKFETEDPVSHMNQRAIQQRVCNALEPGLPVEEFIMSNVTKKDVRRDRVDKLRQTARKFDYSFEKIILP